MYLNITKEIKHTHGQLRDIECLKTLIYCKSSKGLCCVFEKHQIDWLFLVKLTVVNKNHFKEKGKKCLLINAARYVICHQNFNTCYEHFLVPLPSPNLRSTILCIFKMSWNDELLRKNKTKQNYIVKNEKTSHHWKDDNKQTVRSQIQINDAWGCRRGQNFNCTVWRVFKF